MSTIYPHEIKGNTIPEENAKDILKTSFDNGVNFFDTADVYGDGRSEKFVGEFINSTYNEINHEIKH